MLLDPQFHEILEMYSNRPAIGELPIEVLRSAPVPINPNPTQVDKVSEETIQGPGGDLRLRIYRSGAGENLPLLLFIHGGGFILGCLDSHDEIARILTANTGCVTVSVNYRLAPEESYPAAVDDCFAALHWASANASSLGADPDRVMVVGDSAGGNLATVTAMRARDEKAPPIAGQVLLYPTTDLTAPMRPAPDGNFYLLSPETREYFNAAYLSDLSQAAESYVSPGLAESLEGMPPVFLITGEYDPLCEQGEALADRYEQAGVETTRACYKGAIHGFATFPVPMRDKVLGEAADWIKSRCK